MKIRISWLDKLFSEYIRTRDGWTCQRCLTYYIPPTSSVQCCHIFSRSKYSTRWDIQNAVTWCYGCHSYMDRNPEEKYEWYVRKFGKERLDSLRIRSQIKMTIDQKLIGVWLKEMLLHEKEKYQARIKKAG